MFSSDNGSIWPHSNDPLRGAKTFTYDGGLRVPFIIKWPGRVPAGKVNDSQGSFTDILPTLCELTGLPAPSDRSIDGENLLPLFTGQIVTYQRKSPIFFFCYFRDPICMIRDEDWVLLGYDKRYEPDQEITVNAAAKVVPWSFTQEHMEFLKKVEVREFELYNIRTDIGEQHDLATEHPEKVETMKATMVQLREEMLAEGGVWEFTKSRKKKSL